MSVDIVPPLRAYLLPMVAPAGVVTRLPDPYTAPVVQLRPVGGSAAAPVRRRVRLDVFGWHDTDQQAMDLGLDVEEAIWALSGTNLLGVMCYQVAEFLTPRLSDDPIRGVTGEGRRSWATYELTVRDDTIIQPSPAAFD